MAKNRIFMCLQDPYYISILQHLIMKTETLYLMNSHMHTNVHHIGDI